MNSIFYPMFAQVFLALAVLVGSPSTVAAEMDQRVQLTAQLETLYTEGQSTIILRSLHDGSGNWQIVTQRQCAEYPCDPKDYRTTQTVKPVFVEDSRATDGCLVLKLTTEMTLRNCPDWGNKKPYMLVTAKPGHDGGDGSTVQELRMVSFVESVERD